MKRKYFWALFAGATVLSSSCSPIKASPEETSHRMELTLQEVQTNLDDSRHDLHCFRSELQIIDSRLQQLENNLASFKQSYLTQLQGQYENLYKKVNELEKKLTAQDNTQQGSYQNIKKLSDNANETIHVLEQFKNRINQLELSQNVYKKKFDEVTKLRRTIEIVAEEIGNTEKGYLSYRVKPGDSLERIAKKYHVTIDAIKHMNHLGKDLIVIGQELKIPKKSP